MLLLVRTLLHRHLVQVATLQQQLESAISEKEVLAKELAEKVEKVATIGKGIVAACIH